MPRPRLTVVDVPQLPDLVSSAMACLRAEDPDIWHSEDSPDKKQATRICLGCRVRDACLANALDLERGKGRSARWGIAGGKSPSERVAMDPTVRKMPASQIRKPNADTTP